MINILEGMLNPKKNIVNPTRGWISLSFNHVTINGTNVFIIFPMLDVSPIAVDRIVRLNVYVWQNITNVLKEIEHPRYKITIIIWATKLFLIAGTANNRPKIAPNAIEKNRAFFLGIL